MLFEKNTKGIEFSKRKITHSYKIHSENNQIVFENFISNLKTAIMDNSIEKMNVLNIDETALKIHDFGKYTWNIRGKKS